MLNAAVVASGYATGTMHFDASAFAPFKFVLLFFVMAAIDGPLGEEIGWRGVLLPQLMQRFSPLVAALVVGVVWYAWHVPLYAADDKLPALGDHLLFLFSCLALSVIMTWFFLKSSASTFLMVYLHDATNYATFLRFKLFPKLARLALADRRLLRAARRARVRRGHRDRCATTVREAAIARCRPPTRADCTVRIEAIPATSSRSISIQRRAHTTHIVDVPLVIIIRCTDQSIHANGCVQIASADRCVNER